MTEETIALSSHRVLVLGGARSGKSRIAQELAEKSGHELHYLATAQGFDDEMRERIAHHRQSRMSTWRTHEEPLRLAETIHAQAGKDRIILVDCLTLWLSNIMLAETNLDDAFADLERVVAHAAGPLLLVSNEVGLGIVPETPLGRAFRDAQGRLNQVMAASCDTVLFVAAGYPVVVKPGPALSVSFT